MTKMLMIHPEKCIGCKKCELACSVAHGGVRRTGASRVRTFTWKSEGARPRFSVPMMCRQCADAACVKICPTGAMHQSKTVSGLVELDKSACIGCKLCVQVCPFGNVHYDSVAKTIVKCDTCAGAPNCAALCPRGALVFVDDESPVPSRELEFAEKFRDTLRKSAEARSAADGSAPGPDASDEAADADVAHDASPSADPQESS